jgi:hypothetical protein
MIRWFEQIRLGGAVSMNDRFTVLLPNGWLANFAGSEVVTRDLAHGLIRRGPIVYVSNLHYRGEKLFAIVAMDFLAYAVAIPGVLRARVGRVDPAITDGLLAP